MQTTLSILDSTGETVFVESEIVSVVSLSTTKSTIKNPIYLNTLINVL